MYKCIKCHNQRMKTIFEGRLYIYFSSSLDHLQALKKVTCVPYSCALTFSNILRKLRSRREQSFTVEAVTGSKDTVGVLNKPHGQKNIAQGAQEIEKLLGKGARKKNAISFTCSLNVMFP